MAVGSWQLAVGSWQLAVGSWQLAVGSRQWSLVISCPPNHLRYVRRELNEAIAMFLRLLLYGRNDV
ncbi:hypothetical protein QUA00_19435 [Microcoleus sp. T2B6]